MSITAATVWEVRTTGSDTNGGGFDSSFGGVDYTQQNSAQATGTVTSVSTTVTATASIFTSQMVGNMITDGTTWKQITGFTSGTVITVDSAPSWTSASIKVGGGLATPGKVSGLVVASNSVWVKAGTYAMTSSSTNVANGVVSLSALNVGGSASAPMVWEGYNATRGDKSTTRPVFQASGITSATLFVPYSYVYLDNINLDGNSASGINGYSMAWFNCFVRRSRIHHCVKGIYGGGGSQHTFILVEVDHCSDSDAAILADSVSRMSIDGGYIHDNTASGIDVQSNPDTSLNYCIFTNNGGCGTLGQFRVISNIVCYGNTSHGFAIYNNYNGCYINCVAVSNGGYGFSDGNVGSLLLNCAGYNNTSGNNNGNTAEGFITLTGDPFTNAASGDFSLNNTAGAGAALRAAGLLGIFPGGLTTGYQDVGAAQHQDSGGGGITKFDSVF